MCSATILYIFLDFFTNILYFVVPSKRHRFIHQQPPPLSNPNTTLPGKNKYNHNSPPTPYNINFCCTSLQLIICTILLTRFVIPVTCHTLPRALDIEMRCRPNSLVISNATLSVLTMVLRALVRVSFCDWSESVGDEAFFARAVTADIRSASSSGHSSFGYNVAIG